MTAKQVEPIYTLAREMYSFTEGSFKAQDFLYSVNLDGSKVFFKTITEAIMFFAQQGFVPVQKGEDLTFEYSDAKKKDIKTKREAEEKKEKMEKLASKILEMNQEQLDAYKEKKANDDEEIASMEGRAIAHRQAQLDKENPALMKATKEPGEEQPGVAVEDTRPDSNEK
jgi:hypothetical protein